MKLPNTIMKLPNSFRRHLVLVSFLFLGASQSLWGQAPFSKLWTYSASMEPGRKVASVGRMTVGTDGSIGVVVNSDDGAFSGNEYRLYWLDSEMNDLTDDEEFANKWVVDYLQPLAIRKDHLIYLSGDQLRSMTRNTVGAVTDVPVGSAFGSDNITWVVEQSRNPGIFYIVETATDKDSFKIHAYELNPVNNEEVLVSTEVGIDTGFLKMVFLTKADVAYQIQSSVDLVTWVDEGAQIIGTGAVQNFSYLVDSETKKFFRVRKL